MANWKITRDFWAEENNETGYVGSGYCDVDDSKLTEKFRLLDDDGYCFAEGVSDDSNTEEAFEPLDVFGSPNWGCVTIEYLNPETD